MLRYLPLAVGTIVGFGLILNRLVTPELTPSHSRSDALGIFASAMLILVFLLGQQIESKSPESVELIGTDRFWLDATLPESLRSELAWTSHTLLTQTVTRSIVVWYNGRVIHYRGILPEQNLEQPGPIGLRVMAKEQPMYLVKLSLYPGRIEFNYMPENTQGLIVQPLENQGMMVMGSNVSRSYTNQDEAWIKALAAKLSYSLRSTTAPV